MDIVAHGLWGGVVFGRRRFFLAFLLGAGPDLVAFAPFFLHWALEGFPPFPKAPGLRAPALNSIPPYVFTAYNISHSLIVWSVIFLLLFAFFRKPVWVFGAWALHILCDIPTHSTRYFPTPFLWPFPTPYVNGISWSRAPFMITNYLLLAMALGFYIWKKRVGEKKWEVRSKK